VCVYLFGGSAGAGVDCGIKSGLEPPPRRITCTAGDPTSNFVDLGITGPQPLRSASRPTGRS